MVSAVKWYTNALSMSFLPIAKPLSLAGTLYAGPMTPRPVVVRFAKYQLRKPWSPRLYDGAVRYVSIMSLNVASDGLKTRTAGRGRCQQALEPQEREGGEEDGPPVL